MKQHYQDLIQRATRTLESHTEMEFPAIVRELEDLKEKVELAEAELIEREDECEADSEALSQAIEAINKVGDVLEYHTGGLTTQF